MRRHIAIFGLSLMGCGAARDPVPTAPIATGSEARGTTVAPAPEPCAADETTEPCLKRTLASYAVDVNEDQVGRALETVAASKLVTLAPEVMHVFRTLQFARPKAKTIAPVLIKAMRATFDRSVEKELLTMTFPPVEGNDAAAVNQGFWQQTAAFMLGELKSDGAVKALLEMILTPSKAPLHQTALVALVEIGTPSVAPTVAVLRGEDTVLVQHSREQQIKEARTDANGRVSDAAANAAKVAHIPLAAEILGTIGNEAAASALLDALQRESTKNGDPTTRVLLALALSMVPRSAPRIEAFKKTFAATSMELEVPAGPAKELLVSRAADFLDASLVPWLIRAVQSLRGTPEEVDPIRQTALLTVIKLMTADQISDVDKLASTQATTEVDGPNGSVKKKVPLKAGLERQLDAAKALVTKCTKDTNCYFEALADPANHQGDKELTAIKAAYAIGVLGKAADRDRMVDVLPSLSNDSVRFTCLKVIEAMTTSNGAATAAKLQSYFDEAQEAKDSEKMQRFNVFLQTAARLRLRG